jgi:uncharacterized membrane protein YGL010W
MCIPSHFLSKTFNLNNSMIENWATVFIIFALIFYVRLSFSMFVKIAIFAILCIIGNYYLGHYVSLLYASIVIFVIAWIGQFYGHKIEGKKPSFIKDLQFLMIGPAWVIKKITSKK